MTTTIQTETVNSSTIDSTEDDVPSCDSTCTPKFDFTKLDCEKVKKTDSNEDLEVWCYMNPVSSSESSFVKQNRGTVIEKDTSRVVSKTFDYTQFLTVSELEKEAEHWDFDKLVFTESLEGTIIRVYQHEKSDGSRKIYVSTNRKLEASKSKWGSPKSFGEMFKAGIEHLIETQEDFRSNYSSDPEESLTAVYDNFLEQTASPGVTNMYLVRFDNNNRIVCDAPDVPTVYHLCDISVEGNVMFENEKIKVPHPKRFDFKNLEEVIDHVNNCDIRKTQGLIVWTGENFVKLVNDKYQFYTTVRGNVMNVRFRYLTLRNNKKMRDALVELYPDPWYAYCEWLIANPIVEFIYRNYVDRYIRKQWVKVDQEEYNVMRECHNLYMEDREKNRISRGMVLWKVNELPASKLNQIIKRASNDCPMVVN
jgi:hypothetical protein